MTDQLDKTVDAINTNNVIVNAILNTKYREAQEKGILFILKINDLSDLPVRDDDVVTILGNLLDNAIEGAEKADDKLVRVKFVMEEGEVLIGVSNTYADEVQQIHSGDFISGKTDDMENHGLGIKNILEVVETYGGDYSISYDEKEFNFTILISEGGKKNEKQ